MDDNIIQLDAIRIERDAPRKCVCKPEERRYIVDTTNREIRCQCGVTHDPFEAMAQLARNHERINERHMALKQQREKWINEKPFGVLFKKLEQRYKRGKMLPYCPKCDQMFDFADIKSFGSAEFYRKLEERRNKP